MLRNYSFFIPLTATILTSLMSVIVIMYFLSPSSDVPIVMMVPGMDQSKVTIQQTKMKASAICTTFKQGPGIASNVQSMWPQFRGQNRDNINTEAVALATSWPEKSPTQLWSIDVGEGHSGAAVAYGRVYILDYDEAEKKDVLRCLSLDTGEEIWQRGYVSSLKRNHGFSRTVPAISGKYVVTIGPKCHVMCCDVYTGNLYWLNDLAGQFGTTVPLWYTGQCPYIEDNQVIIGIGGQQILMAGLDLATGKILWQTRQTEEWQMSHSSVMPLWYQNRKMWVYESLGGIVAVESEMQKRGQIAWKSSAWKPQVIAPSPVFLPNDRILVTAGYGSGSMILQITDKTRNMAGNIDIANNGSLNPRLSPNNQELGNLDVHVLQTVKVGEGLSSEQQTPILYQNHLFAILPKDAGELHSQLVCVNANDVTKIVWSSGKVNRFGLGPFLIADGKIIVLNDNGVLSILSASTSQYSLFCRASVLRGHDAWGPMALVAGRLILRDSKHMACVDLRAK